MRHPFYLYVETRAHPIKWTMPIATCFDRLLRSGSGRVFGGDTKRTRMVE